MCSQQPTRLPHRSALVLFGSETGNAQDAAEETGRLLERLYFDTLVLDLDSVQLRELVKHTVIIFVISTAGQGELPQNARTFWRSLISAALKPGVLRKVAFTSFGLGDSSYPRYNVAHRMLHARLLQLGAKSFCERGEGNEQHPEGHSAGLHDWLLDLSNKLLEAHPLHNGLRPLPDDALIEPKWKLDLLQEPVPIDLAALKLGGSEPSALPLALQDGYLANVVRNERVTAPTHFQDTRLLDLHLQRDYEYGPGAVAVVHPRNFPEDVQHFIDLMDWQTVADLPLQLTLRQLEGASLIAPSPLRHLDIRNVVITMRWLLENVIDFMSIPRRSFFSLLSHFAHRHDEDQAYQKDRLLELANPELIDELWDYTTRPKRTILEVMMDFTSVKIPWRYALHVLPVMRGRQFSIASGGSLTKTASGSTRVQLLVAIVDPPSPIIKLRRRYGICTRYIASLQPGQNICVGMQQGYLDVQPNDIEQPVIMVGPGTGVAPLRALIHHRKMLTSLPTAQADSKHLHGDILYFGCRSMQDDYYFHDEWQTLSEHEALRICTAFSRDQILPKQYVQDLIKTDATNIASILVDRGGRIYICGSSGSMPKAVREAVLDALSDHKSIESRARAEVCLESLERTGRYKQETW